MRHVPATSIKFIILSTIELHPLAGKVATVAACAPISPPKIPNGPWPRPGPRCPPSWPTRPPGGGRGPARAPPPPPRGRRGPAEAAVALANPSACGFRLSWNSVEIGTEHGGHSQGDAVTIVEQA